MEPDGMRSRPSTPVSWVMMSSSAMSESARKFVMPTVWWWLCLPNCEVRVPLRMSRSTRITFFLAEMKLLARLAETKVFPSPELNEVHIITLIFSFLERKDMFVRTILNASEAKPSLSLSCSGITPRNGALTLPWMSFLVWILVSRNMIIRKMTPGTASPSSSPRSRILFLLGAIGSPGPEAPSITLALLSTIAWERAFSSRLFRRKR